ncbi:MAG: FAD-binding oxidoreductase [Thermoplasmatota archaeon]|nr:FAD-binding oxidoreductase [Candidatus Thermoplasmatota archaeon]
METTDDKMERRLYSHDLAPLPKEMDLIFKTMPDQVVRPAYTQDVVQIVRKAISTNKPIVPRGAGSWGLGGSVPVKGGITIDMTGMNKIISIDETNLVVTVQAGITWKALADALDAKGLFLPCYPSSAPSATLGGWIGTGGTGIGAFKYGSAGDIIRDLEIVLPTTEIVHTGDKLVPQNGAGPNLNWLFVGSEGTMGIVTEVTFSILPKPEELRPVSYSFDDIMKFQPALKKLVRSGVAPMHIMFGDRLHFDYLRAIGKHAPEVGCMVTMALTGTKAQVDYEEKTIDDIFTAAGAKKEPKETAEHEWSERNYEFRVRELGVGAIPGEILVPIDRMNVVLEGTAKIIKQLKMNAPLIGTVADNNTVMLMPYYLTDERKLVASTAAMGFAKRLGDLAFDNGGRPVGLGIFFAGNLAKVRGKEGAKLIRSLKETLDPHGIMNPGKMVETGTRWGISMPAFLMNFGMQMMGSVKRILPRDKIGEKELSKLKK